MYILLLVAKPSQNGKKRAKKQRIKNRQKK